jgi:hypothetical protein
MEVHGWQMTITIPERFGEPGAEGKKSAASLRPRERKETFDGDDTVVFHDD